MSQKAKSIMMPAGKEKRDDVHTCRDQDTQNSLDKNFSNEFSLNLHHTSTDRIFYFRSYGKCQT